jgi:hypothetical protein
MKLADFYARIAPFLLGESDHQAAVSALWGDSPPMPDAKRLGIYGRFCQNHRSETLDKMFEACRQVVLRSHGEAVWTELTEEYFRAHPMHHFELNRNGEYFAEFLSRRAATSLGAAPPLPAFLAELADLEWWEWQASSALDDPSDDNPDAGPLRVGSTVEARPYKWDLITWLDDYEDSERPSEPEADQAMVLFWRDRKLRGRRDHASQLELLIIKAVMESVPLSRELAARLGVPHATLHETAADLHAAGVILGDSALIPSPKSPAARKRR